MFLVYVAGIGSPAIFSINSQLSLFETNVSNRRLSLVDLCVPTRWVLGGEARRVASITPSLLGGGKASTVSIVKRT